MEHDRRSFLKTTALAGAATVAGAAAVATAMVTKRIKPMMIDGKRTFQIGIPIHWGFTGLAKPGFLANTLTPVVGDANAQTPEFKSFLVKVEKL